MDKIINKLYFIVIPLLLVATTVALFYAASTNRKLVGTNKQLLALSQQVKDQTNSIKTQTDSIHEQINCVLNFFAQPAPVRTDSSIASPNPCIITSSSSGGATGSTKSGQ